MSQHLSYRLRNHRVQKADTRPENFIGREDRRELFPRRSFANKNEEGTLIVFLVPFVLLPRRKRTCEAGRIHHCPN
jgi:hypothetical protein